MSIIRLSDICIQLFKRIQWKLSADDATLESRFHVPRLRGTQEGRPRVDGEVVRLGRLLLVNVIVTTALILLVVLALTG